MKYVVAVSGGIDSVALLDMLVKHSPNELVVAHVDHGIRPDSQQDAEFVKDLAKKYNLAFETIRLELGQNASEDAARQARYAWLNRVREQHQAVGVTTAHHADDVLETAVFNILRGTGWRGIASLRSSQLRYRPLLEVSKARLVDYALGHDLEWREDSTNESLRYARNRLRHAVLPKFSSTKRNQLRNLVKKQHELRSGIERAVQEIVDEGQGTSRYFLTMIDDMTALEMLRFLTKGRCDPKQLRKMLHFVKCARPDSVLEAGNGVTAQFAGKYLKVSL